MVKVYENLGATRVILVAPVDTFLSVIVRDAVNVRLEAFSLWLSGAVFELNRAIRQDFFSFFRCCFPMSNFFWEPLTYVLLS